MANTTNYNWETPDDTDLVKDGALAIRTLGSSIDTTTKALNPETTTGDLAYRSATANVKTRLALGTAGQVLTVNSGATAPEWASPGAGGGMTLLTTTTLSGSSTTSATFSSAYKQIYVYMNQVLGNGSGLRIRMNGDTGNNYAFNYQEIATSWSVDRSTAASTMRVGYLATSSSILVNNYNEFTITRPSDTTEVLVTGQGYVGLNSGMFYQFAGVYDSAAAITNITFIPDGGTFTGTVYIYGVN
jgi:hypothetical protein